MTLTLATLFALLAPAAVVIAVYSLANRQFTALQRDTYPLEWALDLSPDRYRPMFRLLSGDDIRFLRSQPGATRALIHGLRRQRCHIFRGYLRCLERDFKVAFTALIFVIVRSQSDRRDLARALVMSRLKFSTSIFLVRCRLLLYRWNIGQEPLTHLVSLFEGLHLELLALCPAPECSGA